MATIYFDMDGTVYPLYQQPDWLERITTREDATAYAADETCVDAAALQEVCLDLIAKGYNIGVIT